LKKLEFDDAKYKLQIWDTAGQELFRSVTRAYYRSTVGIVLVYDVTNRESFTNVRKWLNKIEINASKTITITLVGNKADKINNREVGTAEGYLFAKNLGIPFIETSAKTSMNIDKLFQQLTERIIANEKVTTKIPEVHDRGFFHSIYNLLPRSCQK